MVTFSLYQVKLQTTNMKNIDAKSNINKLRALTEHNERNISQFFQELINIRGESQFSKSAFKFDVR